MYAVQIANDILGGIQRELIIKFEIKKEMNHIDTSERNKITVWKCQVFRIYSHQITIIEPCCINNR